MLNHTITDLLSSNIKDSLEWSGHASLNLWAGPGDNDSTWAHGGEVSEKYWWSFLRGGGVRVWELSSVRVLGVYMVLGFLLAFQWAIE